MIWAFVDYENVGTLDGVDMQKYGRLLVFVGPRHKRINLGDIPSDSFSRLEIIRMETTGNNNLDFHLTFYMGVAHRAADNKISFHVISNDKGFDGLVDHLNSQGRTCVRKASAKKTTSKAATKQTAKKATKKVVTKKVAKKAVKKAAKKVAKKVTTVAPFSEMANKEGSLPSVDEFFRRLTELPQEERPRSKSLLTKWVFSTSNATYQEAKDSSDRMFTSGLVRKDPLISGLIWADSKKS